MAQQADDKAAETPPTAPRRSSPTPPQRPRFGFSPRWIFFVLALLALNLFISTRAMGPETCKGAPDLVRALDQGQAGVAPVPTATVAVLLQPFASAPVTV